MDVLPSYRERPSPARCILLREALVPGAAGQWLRDPMDLVDSWNVWRGNPMAKATLELAVWDCHARQLDTPLRELLGGQRTEILVGASLGMNPVPDTFESVRQHVAQGYKRIKLKIEPGWDV
jgi:O-succinylbenzoate synthase